MSAAIDLVLEALRDPGVKAEVRPILADAGREPEKETILEPRLTMQAIPRSLRIFFEVPKSIRTV